MAFQYRMQRYKKKHRLHTLERWLISTFAALCIAAFIFLVWFFPVRLGNDAMEPTLENGSFVMADRLLKYLRMPRRTDIVLYKDGEKNVHIRRIVSIGGENVSARGGSLYIDGMFRLDEPYASGELGDFPEFTVPAGSVLVLPDNRSWCGKVTAAECIPLEKISAMVYIKYYPRLTLYE